MVRDTPPATPAPPATRRPGSPAWRYPALAAVLALVALGAGCSDRSDDPEAALREMFALAEVAAEAGDADVLVGLLAADYADLAGRDRQTMALTVRGLLLRYPRLELVVSPLDVELISPVLARARLGVAGAGAGAAGLRADGFVLDLSLRDDGDGWRVTSVDWERTAGGI